MLFSYIKLILLFSLSVISTSCYAVSEPPQPNTSDKKIVFLISSPRALSVAFLRMMYERHDFRIYNEYFTGTFDLIDPNLVNQRVKDVLLDSKEANVFLKEVHIVMAPFIGERPEFVHNKNVYYIFLLRNPHHSLISYYFTLFHPKHLNKSSKKRLYLVSEKRFKDLDKDPSAFIDKEGIFIMSEKNKLYTVRFFNRGDYELVPNMSLPLKNIQWKHHGHGIKKAVSSPDTDIAIQKAEMEALLIKRFMNAKKRLNLHSMLSMWYPSLYRTYETLKNNSVNKPIIIHAEELYQDPKKTIENLCKQIQIPYIESALTWDILDNNVKVKEVWHDVKSLKAIMNLHEDAMNSNGFHTPKKYEVDKNGYPTFSEIKQEMFREQLKHIYDNNMIFYNLFLQENS